MEPDTLRQLWEQTLSGGAETEIDWETLPTGATYKAPEAGTVRLGTGFGPASLHLAPSDEAYQADEEIGRGGMGVIYRASQASLGRKVALKRLRDPDGLAPEARRSFVCEALITGRLEHPNIVPVYDLGQTSDGKLHLAMKLVEGQSWFELLERESDVSMHLEILLQVCNAVAFAHSRGVLHNDLKPDNVMVGAFGEVLLMDWGVAVEMDGGATPGTLRSQSSLTNPCGTPAYMPPELAEGRGEDLGPWTDVYLLGGILFRILSGHAPHEGATFLEVIARAARGAVPELGAEHPEELRAICRKALDPDTQARYPSVRALQSALRAFLRHKEALALAEQARQSLARCQAGPPGSGQRVYDGFAEALALFGQARRVWELPDALVGLRAARRAYARAALGQADLGLAQTQLQKLSELGLQEQPEDRRLLAALQEARHKRRSEARGRRWLQAGLVLSLLAILAVVAGFMVREQKRSDRLVEARRGELAQQATLLQAQSPDSLLLAAREHLDSLPSEELGQLSAQQRTRTTELLDGLLRSAQIRQQLIDLVQAPIEQRLVELMPAAQRAELEERLFDERALASQLAIANQAYELAQVIVTGTSASGERLAPLMQAISDARGAQLQRWVASTEAALADLRAGRDRAGRGGGAPSPEEYLIQLSSFRHARIVDVLRDALQPYLDRARRFATREQPIAWSQAEREELRLILQTLGYLELPQHTVPVLRSFFAQVRDHSLAVVCGEALCNTRSQAATAVLQQVGRERFDLNSETWRQIARRFDRLPAPDLNQALGAASAYLERALFLRFRGDTEAALADYDRAIALEPDNATSYLNRANLYASDARHAEALEDYGQAIQRAPDSPLAYANRGLVYRALGDSPRALLDLDQAIRLAPDDAAGYAARAALRVTLGDPAGAVEDYDRALARSPDNARNYFNRASQKLLLGDAQGAQADCDAALLRDPRNREALTCRAEARRVLGDFRGAVTDVSQALALSPTFRLGYLRRGRILLEQGDIERSILDFDKALQLDPQQSDALFYRSDAYQRLDDFESAIADMLAVLALEPENLMALHNLGLLRQQQGQLDRAVELLELVLARDPDFLQVASEASVARSERAQQRLIAGETDAAFEDTRVALENWPRNSDAWALRGVIHNLRGEPEAAIDACAEALALTPYNAVVYGNRGAARLALGQLEEARADFDSFLELRPDDPQALQLRAETHGQLGDHAKAVGDWQRLLELDPRRHSARFGLALAAANAGELETSIAAHDFLLRLEPRNSGLLFSRGLVRKLAGDNEGAVGDVRAALRLDKQPFLELWLAALTGDPEPLRAFADEAAWVPLLARLLLGELSPEELLARPELEDPRSGPGKRCEAHCFIGIWYEQQGQPQAAARHYQACLAAGQHDYQETTWALGRLRKLQE